MLTTGAWSWGDSVCVYGCYHMLVIPSKGSVSAVAFPGLKAEVFAIVKVNPGPVCYSPLCNLAHTSDRSMPQFTHQDSGDLDSRVK